MNMLDDRIDTLIFDMGGILLPVTMQRCMDAFAKLGFEDLDRYVNAYYKDGLFQEQELGNVTVDQFCKQVLTHCHPGTTKQQVVDAWNLFIDPIPLYKLNKILELRKKYKIYLLSNTSEIHWTHACECDFKHDGHDVNDHFIKAYLSFKMHITKPDIEIFEAMLADAHMDPQSSLFIDDAEKNCAAARSLGINAFCSPNGDEWLSLF